MVLVISLQKIELKQNLKLQDITIENLMDILIDGMKNINNGWYYIVLSSHPKVPDGYKSGQWRRFL